MQLSTYTLLRPWRLGVRYFVQSVCRWCVIVWVYVGPFVRPSETGRCAHTRCDAIRDDDFRVCTTHFLCVFYFSDPHRLSNRLMQNALDWLFRWRIPFECLERVHTAAQTPNIANVDQKSRWGFMRAYDLWLQNIRMKAINTSWVPHLYERKCSPSVMRAIVCWKKEMGGGGLMHKHHRHENDMCACDRNRCIRHGLGRTIANTLIAAQGEFLRQPTTCATIAHPSTHTHTF